MASCLGVLGVELVVEHLFTPPPHHPTSCHSPFVLPALWWQAFFSSLLALLPVCLSHISRDNSVPIILSSSCSGPRGIPTFSAPCCSSAPHQLVLPVVLMASCLSSSRACLYQFGLGHLFCYLFLFFTDKIIFALPVLFCMWVMNTEA